MNCSPCGDADAKAIDGVPVGICITDCSIMGEKYYEKNDKCFECNNACKSCKDS